MTRAETISLARTFEGYLVGDTSVGVDVELPTPEARAIFMEVASVHNVCVKPILTKSVACACEDGDW